MKKIIATSIILATAATCTGIVSAHGFGKWQNGERPTQEQMEAHKAEMDARMALMDQVVTTKENISNGIVIKKTSTNAEAVTMLQEQMKKPEDRSLPARPEASTDAKETKRPAFNLDITHTVTNLSDGISITITSSDAEVVKKLQEAEAPEGFGPGMHMPGRGHGGKGAFQFKIRSGEKRFSNETAGDKTVTE